MIGLDTNVIVRYLVQDDPEQAAVATHVFERTVTSDNRGFISVVALCETLWVLGRAYKQTKEMLLSVVELLLNVDDIELEHRDCVWNAYCDWEEGPTDFSDYLLARIGKKNGCEYTCSFDRNAQRHFLFRDPSVN